MANNCTNIYKTSTNLSSQTIIKKKKKEKRQRERHITLVIQVLACDRQNNMVGLNQLMES